MAGALSKSGDTGLRNWLGGGPFSSLRKEMDDLFSKFGFADEAWPKLESVPALDLSETDGTVDLKMDVPGFKADDIDIQIRGDLLTISGTKKEEKEEKGREFHRIERRQGSFSRSVTLPCPVSQKDAKAEYKNGVLTLSLPKIEPVKAQKIAVSS